MEYYNVVNTEYLNSLKRPMRVMKIKLELLDQYDNAVGCIENYISSRSGSITANRQQGCRRTCSIEVIDKDKQYLPQQDSLFWYNRKFKLYTGLQIIGGNTYWFSQGIYYTQTANNTGRVISIEGIDKYGYINGELNTNACDTETRVGVSYINSTKGVKIVDLIRETLSLDMGQGYPIDSVEPLIDAVFYDATLYNDIVLEEGNYIGELFNKIADMYGAYIYYDVDGHLRMEKIFNDDMPYWYVHLAPEYNFGKVELSEDVIQLTNEFKGINTVTVVTDNTEGEIYSYTAQNLNPLSPVSVGAIGVRRYQDGNYSIPLSTSNNTSPTEKCRQQAQYLLMQSICDNLSVSFNYPIIPHIDVDNAVYLNNEYFGYETKPFLVQSMTINLNGEPTNYEVVNIQWLPFDSLTLGVETQYKEIRLYINKARNSTDKVCLSEFSLYDESENLVKIKGYSTSNKTESAETSMPRIYDGKTDTETHVFFSSSGLIIVDFQLVERSTIKKYTFITSNDDIKYDPVSWRIYGRNDDTDWVRLDLQDDATMVEERRAEIVMNIK